MDILDVLLDLAVSRVERPSQALLLVLLESHFEVGKVVKQRDYSSGLR